MKDVQGTLAYARTLSYCSAKVVLTNETNQRLDALSMTLTYKDMAKDISFSGVRKKKSQTREILLIGPPCEDILNEPNIDIKVCKMGNKSEEACKKRVQFVSPRS